MDEDRGGQGLGLLGSQQDEVHGAVRPADGVHPVETEMLAHRLKILSHRSQAHVRFLSHRARLAHPARIEVDEGQTRLQPAVERP